MSFFYDLNKRLADLAKKQNLTEGAKPDFLDLDKDGNRTEPMKKAAKEVDEAGYSAKAARAGKDIGKPGKAFAQIAKSAGERYGSKERGEKVAGAVLKKLRMKEDDMEEGNEFSGALAKAKASGAKEFKVDGKTYQVTSEKKEPKSKGTAFDPEVAKGMFAHKDDKSRYDVKDTGYSKRYTRKAEPEDEQDDEVKSDAPKKRGRPKGPAKGPERVTRGAWKHKDGRKKKTDEDLDTDGVMMTRQSNMSSEDMDVAGVPLVDKGEYDREGDMAKDQLGTIEAAAEELASILSDDENLPEWVQKKITLAMDYIDTARDYMLSQHDQGDEAIAEKAVSQQQQKFMGMVHAMQKGEKIPGASKELKKAAKEMPKKAAKDYAATKHAGLPKKVSETDAEPKEAKKSSKGFQFGKGVYESFDKQFTQALTESMNVSINMSTGEDGQARKNITVSADGDDAEKLAALLKMAGIQSHDHKEVCPDCGQADCGCEQQVDENKPDWPTNTETSDDALQYSGGLNKPKSTGQTTIPVIASQLRRQVSMEEGVELERSLFKLYKEFNPK